MSVLSVLLALLLLAILIVVHEAGHFWAARLTHIDVAEFAVGFGPKILSWKSDARAYRSGPSDSPDIRD